MPTHSSTMSQEYTPEIGTQSFAQGRADFAPYGVGSQSRNLIGHLATSESFNQNQVVPQHQMIASMQQLLLPQQQLPRQGVQQQQQQLVLTSNYQQQPVFSPHSVNQQQQSLGSPQQLFTQMQFLQSQQQQLQLHLSQQQQIQFQRADFGQQQHQFNTTPHHQLQQLSAVGLQQQARSQEPGNVPMLSSGPDQKRQPHHLPVYETSPPPEQPHGESPQQLSFLASQPELAQRHLALMEQELQLEKQLTCVAMEKLKVVDSRGDFRALEEEMSVQRALGHVQKERAELEAETTQLEAAAMRRQKAMLQEALRLEREMEEVVKHREIVILEHEARRLKDLGQKRVAAHQDSLGGGIVGIEAVAIVKNRRGRQGEDTSAGGLVFGDLETDDEHIPRPGVGNEAPSVGIVNPTAREECLEGEMMQEVMQIAAEKQRAATGKDQPARSKDVGEEGGKDGKVGVVNRSMVVDLTNNSTFEVYNSDEDNSQIIPQEHLNELQTGHVDSSSPALPKGQYEEVETGEVDDGLNNKEVLAQQEMILAQIQRENEAEFRTKELLAKLARGEGEEDSKQVVAEKQDVRPIGTDLSEFIVVAVKKRQMKMAKKSGGDAGEVIHEMRRSEGEEDFSHRQNELKAERKKSCELVRQRTAALEKVHEIQVMPKRNEAATRVIEEAKKKRMMAEKKKQFKPSWEKQPELVGPSQGDAKRMSTSRSYGK